MSSLWMVALLVRGAGGSVKPFLGEGIFMHIGPGNWRLWLWTGHSQREVVLQTTGVRLWSIQS